MCFTGNCSKCYGYLYVPKTSSWQILFVLVSMCHTAIRYERNAVQNFVPIPVDYGM